MAINYGDLPESNISVNTTNRKARIMNKVLLIAFLLVTISSVFAEDTHASFSQEDTAILEQLEGLNELSMISKTYVDLHIHNSTLKNPKGFESAARAPCNTFRWYMLREFETAEGLEKLKLFEIITK